MNLFNRLKEVWNRMFSKDSLNRALNTDANISQDMSNAIDFWMSLYKGKAPWLAHNRQSLNLPVGIASEIARLVTLESKIEISGAVTDKQQVALQLSNDKRAEFLTQQVSFILENLKLYTEYACAGGGLFFKPYPLGDQVAIDVVQANAAYPLSFDSKGRITSAAFIETQIINSKYFRRLETHTWKSDGSYEVTNQAYKASTNNDLGTLINLSEVAVWSHLAPVVTLKNVKQPLFSYFKVPLGNTVDPTSPLGVSVYSRAVDLIRDADKQYQRLNWEFEGGELAIDVSQDVLYKEKGRVVMPEGKERLFRPNNFKDDNGQGLMTPFSPELRDESYLNGLNSMLQKIEFLCGLAYGTISDPQNVDKTATEIKISRQRSYSTVNDVQKALRVSLEDLIYSVDVYTTLYSLAPEGEYDLQFTFDDSIIVDAETERVRDMTEVRDGLMSDWEYRVKWHGETEEKAKEMLGYSEEVKTDAQIMGFTDLESNVNT